MIPFWKKKNEEQGNNNYSLWLISCKQTRYVIFTIKTKKIVVFAMSTSFYYKIMENADIQRRLKEVKSLDDFASLLNDIKKDEYGF